MESKDDSNPGLVKKNTLTYKKESRVFVYTPLIKEDEYIKYESKSFLDRFYNGALNSMVLNFLEHEHVSKEDIHELRTRNCLLTEMNL